MKKECITVILLSLFLSIDLNAQNTQNKNYDVYGIMMSTSDSLLSKEMLQTKYQITYYFFTYTDLEGGKLVFKPDNTNENYKKLPKLYIDHMMKNIEELNNWTDTAGRNKFMNSFPEIKRSTLAKLKKMEV